MARQTQQPGVSIKINGDPELLAALAALPKGMTRRVMSPAVTAAMKPMVRAARSKVPTRAPFAGYSGGQLKKSLGAKTKVYPRKGIFWVGIGARTGFKIVVQREKRFAHWGVGRKPVPINPVNYAHLVEFGMRHSAAQPFLRPAFDEQNAGAFGILTERIRTGIIKETARAAARSGR